MYKLVRANKSVIIILLRKGGKMDTLISVRHLYKLFKMGNEKVYALRDVNLEINRGEMVCLLGPSGSGKSTLLNALAGLEKPTKGEIVIGGLHLEEMSESKLTFFRSLNIGFVFQSYNLIPTLSALENVSMSLMFKGMAKKDYIKAAEEALRLVGLEDRMKHKPNELSGGQQQRVSIARALVGRPKILFADEPTGNLDSKTSFEVMDIISGIAHKENITVIMVTHDEEMTKYADRLFHMRDGSIERIHNRTELAQKGDMEQTEIPAQADQGESPEQGEQVENPEQGEQAKNTGQAKQSKNPEQVKNSEEEKER